MNTQPQKIAIVTGANNGIGFETAAGMAEAGYHVVMACRSQAKAEAARDELIAKVPSASLDIILLDLGDFAYVQRFAEDFRARYEKLDVLINNAGILLYSAQTNGGGIELQFATNHLGHFLLTALLIDLMPDNPASRIVALSSLGHKGASIHFDDLTCGGDGGIAYGQSKLACLLFGDELDRRLRASGRKIKALSVHPGGSDSGLFTDMSDAQRSKLKAQVEQFLHSNASAAKPALHAALSPDVKGGDYYGPTGPQEMSGEVGHATRDLITGDLDVAGRLWRVSEELTGKTFSL
ncbi:MAG: oxidoreductase [Ruegeria sp.]|uniref:oxidoreductase n=1 Tax=Ruegeria sp. TaxID=1879320 RepID=UPI00349EF712